MRSLAVAMGAVACWAAAEAGVLSLADFKVSEPFADAPWRTYEIEFDRPAWRRVTLSLGDVQSLAEVSVNGKAARTLWCEPYECDVTADLKEGRNRLVVKTVSGWRNRLIRDAALPEAERETWTVPALGKDEPKARAGLYGPVELREGTDDGAAPYDLPFAADDRPETWFHLIGGNVSREGMTADLEAIRAAGIGGIQFFHGQFGGPWPGVPKQIPCLSAEWDALVRHVGLECRRLGLTLMLQNCPGWSMSGGPWIDDAHAMRKIVLDGKGRDYRELATVEVPVPAGADDPAPVVKSVTTNGDVRVYAFAAPVRLRTLVLPGARFYNHGFCFEPDLRATFEARTADGWRTVLDADFPQSTFADNETESFSLDESYVSDEWRLTIAHGHEIRPSGRLPDPQFLCARRHDGWERKAGWALRDAWSRPVPRRVGEGGGRTRTLRFGHVNPEITNHPAPKEATGWECDKLDPKGADANFAGYVGRLLAGPLKGVPVKGVLIDSWECGVPSWTWRMPEYFREINGYDLERWLPALFGYTVDSDEATDSFLRDWRRTQGKLVTKNYYGRFAELAHERGLILQHETSSGDVIAGDILEYWKNADVPMCEFWSPHRDREGFVGSYNFKPVRPCVSAAHVYGKRRVAAEAFTSFALDWNESLRGFKRDADKHFARGVTHLVFHTYTHNPRVGMKGPGSSFGAGIGSPFTRLQSWWPYMPKLTDYFARCGRMLERGKAEVDVLWYIGDDCGHKPNEKAEFLDGHKYDYCTFDALATRAAARDGRIAFPDGASYAAIWIPDGTFLRPETKGRLAELERAGAKVVRGGLAALKPALPPPDVAYERPSDERLDDFMWYHRTDAKEDVYFFATSRADGYRGRVTLRAKGAAVVVDPVRRVSRPFDGTLDLPPDGSAFVVVTK